MIIHLLLSVFTAHLQVTPTCSFTMDEVAQLTDRIQNAGTEVVEAKAGAVSRCCVCVCVCVCVWLWVGVCT